jgi:isopentenyl diphosphate isomerase/L-lactate dehydrogenase-like FMN-dependent dehydrogenase
VGACRERAGWGAQLLTLLNEELALTMTLAGCARLSDITPDLLYGDPMFRKVRFDARSLRTLTDGTSGVDASKTVGATQNPR